MAKSVEKEAVVNASTETATLEVAPVITLSYLKDRANFTVDGVYDIQRHYKAVEGMLDTKIKASMEAQDLETVESLLKVKTGLAKDLAYSIKNTTTGNSPEKEKKISKLRENIESLKRDLEKISAISDEDYEKDTAFKSLNYYFRKLESVV